MGLGDFLKGLGRGIAGMPGEDDLAKVEVPEFKEEAFDMRKTAGAVKDNARSRLDTLSQRQAPQMDAVQRQAGQVDRSQINQTNQQQAALGNLLMQGENPSVAALQAANQQQALLAQSRAGNALQARQQNQAMAPAMNNLQAQAGAGMVQERAQDRSAYQNILNQQRQGMGGLELGQARMDQGAVLDNAGALNKAGALNQRSNIQNQQLMDQATQFYESQRLGAGRTSDQALFNQIKLDEQAQNVADVARANMKAQGKQNRNSLLKQITGGVVSAAFDQLSDKKQKKNVKKPAYQKLQDMLDGLDPAEYEYKDDTLPGTSPGTNLGVIAQDLQETKAGKDIVKETDNGLMIDGGKALGMLLASVSHLNKRLNDMEDK